MKSSIFVTLNLAVLLITGCTTVPTQVDTGPMHALTFSFIVRDPGTTSALMPDPWEPIHSMIQDSISHNLAGKGLSRLTSGGDVIVAYLVITGNHVSTSANSDYFGSGRDVYLLHDQVHDAYTHSQNPNHLEAGTLLVDFIDAQTYKLLKRSYVVRPLLRNPTTESRAELIQEAVDAVLKDVRITL